MFSIVPEIINNTKYEHVNLTAVLNYIQGKGYPSYIITKNEKANFRRQCKFFTIQCDSLVHKKNLAKVIFDAEERKRIIEMVHDGSDQSLQSSALSSHRGRDATQRVLQKRFYWPNMTVDVKNYVRECVICQKVNPSSLKFVPELKSVHVPKKVDIFFSVITNLYTIYYNMYNVLCRYMIL